MTWKDMPDSLSDHPNEELEHARLVRLAEQLFFWRAATPWALHKIVGCLNAISLGMLEIEDYAEFHSGDSEKLLDHVGRIKDDLSRAMKIVQVTRKRGNTIRPVLSERLLIRDVVQPAIKHVNKDLLLGNWEVAHSFKDCDYVVNLDAALARECLIDLLNNAVWAVTHNQKVQEKQVTVSVSNFVNDDRVKIEIQDSGVGIVPEIMSELFTPFFTTREDGVGLGLYLARRMIHHFGGTISITTSIPGKGTTVEVRLPFMKLSETKDLSL